jgi:hypothetical protein
LLVPWVLTVIATSTMDLGHSFYLLLFEKVRKSMKAIIAPFFSRFSFCGHTTAATRLFPRRLIFQFDANIKKSRLRRHATGGNFHRHMAAGTEWRPAAA